MTEGFGRASIFSDEWLRKPGFRRAAADGRAAHPGWADGADLPPGEAGVIWFEGGTPSSTTATRPRRPPAANERGWRTVGDVGYLDEDGYLYLTDRASNLIISGGVNIYPQEIENVLTMHPEVLDAAVLGVPDPEMGEQGESGRAAGALARRACPGRPGRQARTGPRMIPAGPGRPPGRLLPRAPGRVQVPAVVRSSPPRSCAAPSARSAGARFASSSAPPRVRTVQPGSRRTAGRGGITRRDDRLML